MSSGQCRLFGENNSIIQEIKMSLQPVSTYIVPEQTARVAHAAFAQSSLCMRLYDQLGTIFQDQDFADSFPESGQPGQSPFRLALITILQFLEGLSDRNAADAVRGRIDWKYLMCLELENPGFDYSVLCEFRSRLLEGGAEHRLFDADQDVEWVAVNEIRKIDPVTVSTNFEQGS
jgi:transposase